MKKEDQQFISTINGIARLGGWDLPALDDTTATSSDVVSAWAEFLRECVTQGIALSDPRWTRVIVKRHRPTTQFGLVDDDATPESGEEEDFRVGLRLLMGSMPPDGEA